MVDDHCMTLNFLAKHRFTSDCQHKTQMRIEIAGMSREVCESCGKVSVSFIEDHFKPEHAQRLRAARSASTSAESSED